MPISKSQILLSFIGLFLLFGVTESVLATSVEQSMQELETITSRVPFPLDLSQAPTYTGGIDDYDYLHNYLLDYAIGLYDVDSSIFDEPTIVSTGILRDLVHRFNYSANVYLSTLIKNGEAIAPAREDIAEAWRYPSRGICGQISFALYKAFRAFGYETNRINAFNGQVGIFGEGYSYSASHASTEIYIPALDRFVIQDPTYNTLILDTTNQEPLGWLEAHTVVTQASKSGEQSAIDSITFRPTWVATGYPNRTDTNSPAIPQKDVELFTLDYFDIPHGMQAWHPTKGERTYSLFDMFRTAKNAHAEPTPVGVGDTTGFELIDLPSGDVISTWETVRQEDGTYLSTNLDTGIVLNGSYDQLIAEAINGDLILNPGVDLSEFEGTANIVTLDGIYTENLLIWARNNKHERCDSVSSFGISSIAQSAHAITGDWNGNGFDDIGLFNDGYFYLDTTNNGKWDKVKGGDMLRNFGIAGINVVAKPVVGDWNGDGQDDLGIYNNGYFYLDTTGNGSWDKVKGGDTFRNFGIKKINTTAKPVIGDWNGDGSDDLGLFNDGFFYLDTTGNGSWDQ